MRTMKQSSAFTSIHTYIYIYNTYVLVPQNDWRHIYFSEHIYIYGHVTEIKMHRKWKSNSVLRNPRLHLEEIVGQMPKSKVISTANFTAKDRVVLTRLTLFRTVACEFVGGRVVVELEQWNLWRFSKLRQSYAMELQMLLREQRCWLNIPWVAHKVRVVVVCKRAGSLISVFWLRWVPMEVPVVLLLM